ncbi:hypothetical protein D3C81_412260 [compost metagenome]
MAVKIARGFRYAQTLLNLAFARFLGQFLATSSCEFEKKQKQLGIRYAHRALCSLRSV